MPPPALRRCRFIGDPFIASIIWFLSAEAAYTGSLPVLKSKWNLTKARVIAKGNDEEEDLVDWGFWVNLNMSENPREFFWCSIFSLVQKQIFSLQCWHQLLVCPHHTTKTTKTSQTTKTSRLRLKTKGKGQTNAEKCVPAPWRSIIK